MAGRTQFRPGHTAGPTDASRTITIHDVPTGEQGGSSDEAGSSSGRGGAGVLRLRGAANPSRRVVWQEGTVDNEGMGRKKSKICCIYHKPKAFDESSDEDSSSSSASSDDSDEDSDSSSYSSSRSSTESAEGVNATKALRDRRAASKKSKEPNDARKEEGCRHKHGHEHNHKARKGKRKVKSRGSSTMVVTETKTEESEDADPDPVPNAYERGPA